MRRPGDERNALFDLVFGAKWTVPRAALAVKVPRRTAYRWVRKAEREARAFATESERMRAAIRAARSA